MTTAFGSTTSSSDTVLTVDDAPFGEYIKILRKEGYKTEAEEIEGQCLEIFEALGYTEKDLNKTPLKNVHRVIEIYTIELNRQMLGAAQPPSISGNVLLGEGADKLEPEQVEYLLRRQMQLHEEEKLNQMLKR